MVFGQRMLLTVGLATTIVAAASRVDAQTTFKVAEHEVQVHGFLQQGFVASSGNNFLTMPSDGGSVEMTDGGINLSTKVNDKLRVGAQVYTRNIGQFGNGHLEMDWAFADYRVNEWIGFRAGKVKTSLGLINDTQDMEFLHTWALLPQAVYPLDLRSVTIAHAGADAYGTIAMKKAGSLAYTAYGGVFPDDKRGGYRYGIEDLGLQIPGKIKRQGGGFDLRWTLPIEGLQIGYSLLESTGKFDYIPAAAPIRVHLTIDPWRMNAFYGDYQKDKWHFSGEWRRQNTGVHGTPQVAPDRAWDSDGWFLAAAYRLYRPLEIGTYYSRFVANTSLDAGDPNNHISGPVVTSRFDLTKNVSIKVEGHFVDGHGDPTSPHGYYTRDNKAGLANSSNMLVVRTAFSF
jgi:hypothetical protein